MHWCDRCQGYPSTILIYSPNWCWVEMVMGSAVHKLANESLVKWDGQDQRVCSFAIFKINKLPSFEWRRLFKRAGRWYQSAAAIGGMIYFSFRCLFYDLPRFWSKQNWFCRLESDTVTKIYTIPKLRDDPQKRAEYLNEIWFLQYTYKLLPLRHYKIS